MGNLNHDKKRKVRNMRVYNGCEWLSNWWFCSDKQPTRNILCALLVVNCLQISNFVLWQTAKTFSKAL